MTIAFSVAGRSAHDPFQLRHLLLSMQLSLLSFALNLQRTLYGGQVMRRPRHNPSKALAEAGN